MSREPHPLNIPDFLKISQEERAEAWRRQPPRPMPKFQPVARVEDEQTRKFRAEWEQQRKGKTMARIAKMKAGLAAKAANAAEEGEKWVPPVEVPSFNPPLMRGHPPVVQRAAIPAPAKASKTPSRARSPKTGKDDGGIAAGVSKWVRVDGDIDLQRLRRLAEANGVWNDRYAALSNGLAVMNVVNRLRAKAKKGEKVTWLKK